MAADGHALIFISHKLHEVLEISDRVTVLRDGQNGRYTPTCRATRAELAEMMVGRPVISQYTSPGCQAGGVVLDIRNVTAPRRPRQRRALKDLRTVSLSAGEILALAGVSGNGQRELAESGTVCAQDHQRAGVPLKGKM